MGDVLSLIEDVEQKLDKAKAEKLIQKVKKGQNLRSGGSARSVATDAKPRRHGAILGKLPGMGDITAAAEKADVGKQFKQMEAIIGSMTPSERRDPELINNSRKRRIALGSGTDVQDINRLLKQHKQMAKMMKNSKVAGCLNAARYWRHDGRRYAAGPWRIVRTNIVLGLYRLKSFL